MHIKLSYQLDLCNEAIYLKKKKKNGCYYKVIFCIIIRKRVALNNLLCFNVQHILIGEKYIVNENCSFLCCELYMNMEQEV